MSGALMGQSVAREVDGLGEHRLPQASVDRRDRHPLTEDLASRGERVAVTVLDAPAGDPLEGTARVLEWFKQRDR